jgi:hypothetical protein
MIFGIALTVSGIFAVEKIYNILECMLYRIKIETRVCHANSCFNLIKHTLRVIHVHKIRYMNSLFTHNFPNGTMILKSEEKPTSSDNNLSESITRIRIGVKVRIKKQHLCPLLLFPISVERYLSPRSGLKLLKSGNAMTAFHARCAAKAGANCASLKGHAKTKIQKVKKRETGFDRKNNMPGCRPLVFKLSSAFPR